MLKKYQSPKKLSEIAALMYEGVENLKSLCEAHKNMKNSDPWKKKYLTQLKNAERLLKEFREDHFSDSQTPKEKK